MKIKISSTRNPLDYEKIHPNIIYNRFDLFCKEDQFGAVKINNGQSTKIVEYMLSNDMIELGLWLTPITVDELEALLIFLKNTHPQINKIISKNSTIPYGKVRSHNYFRIEFPDTIEEMKKRVSTRSWSKMRGRNRRAEEIYGEMQILEYSDGNIPLEIVEKFFEFKLATHNRVYDMSASEYLERYHVSNCYVVMFGSTIGAIYFSCEQCPVVYCENHTYNPELLIFSLGKFIFSHAIIRMVEKHHTQLFLAGGDYEYKTHYGSIEETVYDCVIPVDSPAFADLIYHNSFKYRCKQLLKKYLPISVVNFLKKLMSIIRP